MLTSDDLLGIQGRVMRWQSMNSGTKFRSTGGNQLVRRVMETDVPALLTELNKYKQWWKDSGLLLQQWQKEVARVESENAALLEEIERLKGQAQ